MRPAELARRLALGALVALVAGVAYRSIQFHALTSSDLRTSCPGWELFPFNELWLWPYLSMFVLVGLPWLLLSTLAQVHCFARRLLAVAAVGWICFLLFPTACLRPSTEGLGLAYRLLIQVDAPNNCFPCLHSAMALLAARCLSLGAPRFAGWPARLALLLWVICISLSIVALRQHTALDTLAGLLLGLLGSLAFPAGTGVLKGSVADSGRLGFEAGSGMPPQPGPHRREL